MSGLMNNCVGYFDKDFCGLGHHMNCLSWKSGNILETTADAHQTRSSL